MGKRKLTVLFAPGYYVGAMMSSIGMAEVLRDSGGHRCVFAVTDDWKSRLEAIGFEVKVVGEKVDGKGMQENNVEELIKNGTLSQLTPMEKLVANIEFFYNCFIMAEKEMDPYVKTIIADTKPDIIISDNLITLPSIVTSGVPWIFSWSNSPLSLDFGINDERLPPSALGLPTNSEKEVKEKYRKLVNEAKAKLWYKHRDRVIANGCPVLQEFQLWTTSPFANIYMTSKELDYTDIRPLPDTFHGFDCYKRSGNLDDLDAFELPEKLRNKSGKLIYLSLGSMGSGNVELMKKLVAILAKSKHRFIVSKGVKHNKYELADNMWGEKSVPQIKVLPLIDLMLTHGGNNTVTETMYFGKPMIVLPLFFDQYDNAQRVTEKGFGVRLDPYECSEQQLLQSIENLTVLFAPLSFVGPMMSSIGMAEVLRDSGGHRCVFAVTNDWIDRLESMGFETKLAEKPVNVSTTEKCVTDSANSNANDLLKMGGLDNISPFQKVVNSFEFVFNVFIKGEEETDPYLKLIIADLKPDVIISDHIVNLSSIVNSGIPWIFSWSNSPLSLDYGYENNALPPSFLGLPTNSETEVKEKYRTLLNAEKQKISFKINQRSKANGMSALKEFQIFTPSPFANLYLTPKELDYTDIRPLPDTFHRFDYYKRSGNLDTFEIPEKLKDKSGKLIYLSLGSMGIHHNEYDLPGNMWGDRTVSQIKVLPICDLVITHGGNNTVTETMYFGKPMIVLPIVCDQYDNAQRVQEKGFGIGMAEVLRDSGGHRCVFAVTNNWVDRLESLGFETILIENSVDVDNKKSVTDSADSNVSVLLSTGAMGNISAFDKAVGIIKYLCEEFIPSELKSDPYMKKIITALKPSVIITDRLVTLPSIVNSGIPWILSWSGCPLLLDFGYEDNTLQPSLLEFQLFTPSPFANIYMTPKELDYTDIRPLPDNYHGFDNFKRSGNLDTF
ncbi:unnamed protein product [Medioppia subpectinata]|uniref:Glycosyl transferase family 28 C-terminal domain-containing protein n=1 Tax=Medioppia subpectinata TaxID=1979941 RepID=A0A7R9PX42_9ACAR|nr:unnamed protein product [Medioppia subpectinata]CAG2104427.1 unnamed protein product [Medioppia subpectinata]